MRLPAAILRHRLTVEPLEGEGSGGPTYGTPFTLRCWVDGKRGTTTSDRGEQVTSTAAAIAQLEDADRVPVGSRVTDADGHVLHVLEVKGFDAAGLPAPSHVEIALG